MTKRAERCVNYLRNRPWGATAVEINAALHTTEARKIISEVIRAGYHIEKEYKVLPSGVTSRCIIYKLVNP